MATTEADILEALRGMGVPVLEIDQLPNGRWRARTSYLYPDGDSVDVFVGALDGEPVLSDFGQTFGWVFDATGSSRKSEKRLYEKVLQIVGIREFDGTLNISLADGCGADSVTRLARACVVVAMLESSERKQEMAAERGGEPTVGGWYWARHHEGEEWFPTLVARVAGAGDELLVSCGCGGDWKQRSSVFRWGPRIFPPSEG